MSTHSKNINRPLQPLEAPTQKLPTNKVLNSVLDFGPEETPAQNAPNERIRKIINKLKELSRRIDSLAANL